jgi:hypothetical protein
VGVLRLSEEQLMDRYTGDLCASRAEDGTPVIEVLYAGPMRVSVQLIGGPWVRLDSGVVSFLGQDRAGEAVELRYRVVGVESGGENNTGWLLTEPCA